MKKGGFMVKRKIKKSTKKSKQTKTKHKKSPLDMYVMDGKMPW